MSVLFFCEREGENYVFKKINIFASLWLLSCGLYLTKIIYISPIYFSFFFVCMGVVFQLSQNAHQNFNFKIDFFWIGISIPCFIFLGLFVNSPISLVGNLLMSFISPFIVVVLFKKRIVTTEFLFFVFFSYAILFCTDGVWRIFHPEMEHWQQLESLGVGFQIYKINSIMYLDSNFVGIQIVAYLSCFIYLFRDVLFSGYLRFFYFSIVFFLLISLVLSFSRSAYLGAIIIFFFNFVLKNRIRYVLFLVCSPFLVIAVCSFVLNYFSNDISFASKFYIISLTVEYVQHSTWFDIFFGVGLGGAEQAIGMGAHNLLLSLFIETGLVGVILFVYVNILFICKLQKDFLIVGFPFIFSSMSLGTTAIPYYFTFLSICVLHRDKSLVIFSKKQKVIKTKQEKCEWL